MAQNTRYERVSAIAVEMMERGNWIAKDYEILARCFKLRREKEKGVSLLVQKDTWEGRLPEEHWHQRLYNIEPVHKSSVHMRRYKIAHSVRIQRGAVLNCGQGNKSSLTCSGNPGNKNKSSLTCSGNPGNKNKSSLTCSGNPGNENKSNLTRSSTLHT
ncbi:hypothetical protein AVEN_208095-1 [Araneus ventricosus]|uniref:Uncharacterized protein n=1 Tax=Araneus ventricosus TaxID=182803 RepID=A0A4Y2FXQ4_ARAVE|nr:hypothetical protein AVEN_208095-1 [Araneus ventricosus]